IKNNSFVNQIIVLTHKNIRPSAITFLHGINILPGYIALLNFFQPTGAGAHWQRDAGERRGT
ncbi:hypothetical protein MJM99_31300, partial [Salmonella enterica subsp. enterica serovar Kentucky]|nr:hypothetical protein [Salmonella enterica subsp. enterica serovar Kentucky]